MHEKKKNKFQQMFSVICAILQYLSSISQHEKMKKKEYPVFDNPFNFEVYVQYFTLL